MTAFRVQGGAGHRLDEIYSYTRQKWGEEQAECYIRGLFDIAAREFPWVPLPAEFGVDGFVCRHEKHFIYWKVLADGNVGIVTVMHKRMHQIERLKDDIGR